PVFAASSAVSPPGSPSKLASTAEASSTVVAIILAPHRPSLGQEFIDDVRASRHVLANDGARLVERRLEAHQLEFCVLEFGEDPVAVGSPQSLGPFPR